MRIRLILTYSLFLTLIACDKQVTFESDKWKSSGGELILTDQRLQMTQDLLNRELLINISKAQVDSMLGPPTRTMKSNEKMRFYLVKEVYSFDIDPDELIFIKLHFNDLGKSIKAELIKE
jgi:hypothetical protein